MKKCFLSAIILCVILSASALVCLAEDKPQAPEFAGEFFGQHVPIGNYYFAKRVVMSFSAGWRGTPEDEKQLEDMVWQELLFSFEAFRRNIAATSEEIDTEIEKILKSNNVEFSFRVDKEKFQEWAQSTLGVDVETFRNQVEHLIKLEKLRKEALNSSDPQVTEEEAFQKFLDEYNTLLVELKQFDEKADAEKFYQEAIKPVPEQGLELLIWKDLLLSYEVFRRKIDITEEETDKEIEKTLREMEAQV
ncbi:MAG: hypothetical protein HY810_03555 [Candidatus Omnitrophica bacterium]|nr:hypothetical protein [Candidatus Omnitrophota bacterium]